MQGKVGEAEVEDLLQQPQDPNLRDLVGRTLLHCAAASGDEAVQAQGFFDCCKHTRNTNRCVYLFARTHPDKIPEGSTI